MIRLKQATSQWHFTPKPNGMVLVESFAHINPSGPMPAWITNMIIVNSPFQTLKRVRSIVKSGAYDNKTVSFLK